MSKRSRFWALLLSLAVTAARGLDCFVLIDNIPGESTDPWHTNWIEARIVGSEVSRPSLPSRPAFQLHFTKPTDKSSPLLALRTAEARRIDRAAIEFVTDTGRRLRFYRISLTNAYLTAFQQSAQPAAQNRPDEDLALVFDSISWTYTEIDPAGMPRRNIGAFWDLLGNRGGSTVEPLIRLTGSKNGGDMVVSWSARAGITYKVLGSPQASGPFNFVQNITATSNATIRATFPIAVGNLFFIVETAPETP